VAEGGAEEQRYTAIKTAMQQSVKESKMPFTLDGVSIDPRSHIVTVEYTVPNMGSATDTKHGLLYAGYRLIWAAMPHTPDTQFYTLRGNAYLEGSTAPTLALTADVMRDFAEKARSANEYTTVQEYLSNPWWHSKLASAPM
jgi:hypothetical protein